MQELVIYISLYAIQGLPLMETHPEKIANAAPSSMIRHVGLTYFGALHLCEFVPSTPSFTL